VFLYFLLQLGYGKKHPGYKTVILAAASGRPLPSENVQEEEY
jgi:hypothetical protein